MRGLPAVIARSLGQLLIRAGVLAAAASLTAMEETEPGDPGAEAVALSALAELREPDPRSLMWFVGGSAAVEVVAEHQKRVMARLDVPASVPEAIAKSFDRVRSIYRQGLFCYDLYTVAGDQARLLVEQALKERFIEFYGGTVLFTHGQGKTQTDNPPIRLGGSGPFSCGGGR